jgi:hypothetical protein
MTRIALWWRWVLANALGELVGLGGVFAVGAAVAVTFGEPRGAAALLALLVLVVVLATFEGAVVGYAQWRVLRAVLPALRRGTWVTATVVGAVVSWLLGMIPSTLGATGGGAAGDAGPAAEPRPALLVLLASAMGAVLGLVLSCAQWWVLRRHVARAGWWLPAHAAAWAVAMPLIFQLVGVTLAESRTAASLAALILGIGAAGAVVGAIHGLAAICLFLPAAAPAARRGA